MIRPDAVQLLVEPSSSRPACRSIRPEGAAWWLPGWRSLVIPPYGSAGDPPSSQFVHIRSSTAHTLCISCACGVRTERERAREREGGRAASQPCECASVERAHRKHRFLGGGSPFTHVFIMATMVLATMLPLSFHPCVHSIAPRARAPQIQMQIGGGIAIKAIPPPPPPSPTDIASKFSTWCSDNGVEGLSSEGACALQLEESPSGEVQSVGLFATRDVKEGEMLLGVPLKLALADRVLVGVDGVVPTEPFVGAPWQMTLAARVLALEIPLPCRVGDYKAHLTGVEWEPYIDMLLLVADDGPGDVAFAEAVITLAEVLVADPRRVVKAYSLAMQRGFELEVDGAVCHTLLPLVDLFALAASDEESHAVVALDDESDIMRFTASRAIARGEQLTLAL